MSSSLGSGGASRRGGPSRRRLGERGSLPRPQSSVFVLPSSVFRPRSFAFTLVELLAVIAVIGILAAILFPSLSAARRSAHRAKTKVQFNQWAAAIESFRSEYGYYPAFDSTNLVNGGATTTLDGDHLFHDILAGRKRDGTAPSTATATSAGSQNRKRIVFHSFHEGEFTSTDATYPHLLKNAFAHLSIAVLVDRNLDGKIDAADYATLPAVALADGTTARPTSGGAAADVPASGVRTGVAFYCADPRATAADPQFIFSWK